MQVKPNTFDYFPNYFLQKAIVYAISTIRGKEGKTPTDIINWCVHLLKNNDNSHNAYSDDYYVASILHSLGNIRPPGPTILLEKQIERFLAREKTMPSYHHVITIACLSALSSLQQEGVCPKNLGVFREYTRFVRRTSDLLTLVGMVIMKRLE